MKVHLPRILVIIICLILLVYTTVYTSPPKSWEQASTLQILTVFLPILIIGTILADLYFKYLPRSFIFGLAIVIMMVLQALKQLTPLIALGIILVSILSVRLLPKIKTINIKNIPKLKLSNNPKGSTLTKLKRRDKS